MGATWVIGRGLRILAELPGPDGCRSAREAVDALTESSARLEAAKARATLGDALAEAGAAEEARAEWAAAAELAEACGAAGLARRAAEAAAGGEPRRRRGAGGSSARQVRGEQQPAGSATARIRVRRRSTPSGTHVRSELVRSAKLSEPRAGGPRRMAAR